MQKRKEYFILSSRYKLVTVLLNMPLLVSYSNNPRHGIGRPHLHLSITRGIIVAAIFLPYPELVPSIEFLSLVQPLGCGLLWLYIVSAVV